MHWHARSYRRLFPEMEADLLARPLPGARSELVVDAACPPGGLLGVAGDVLFGRLVARSTAAAFTGRLARAMAEAVGDGRCNGWAMPPCDQVGGVTMRSLDHGGLLTLARKAYAAAGDADTGRLTEDLGAFVHALAHHLDRELPTLTHLPPAEARLVRRGQARVSAAARALLRDAEGGCAGPGRRCAARAEELLALLTIQARDERLALLGVASGAPNWRWPR